MKAPTRKSTVTRIRPNRQPRGVSAAEWDARCELAALTGGAEPNPIPQETIEYTKEQGRELSKTGRAAGGKLLWAALLRKLDRRDPGYRC